MLGRVSSLDWLISIGLLPLSFALTGPVSALVGAQATLVIAGVAGAAVTLGGLLVPGVRDIERSSRRDAAPAVERAAGPRLGLTLRVRHATGPSDPTTVSREVRRRSVIERCPQPVERPLDRLVGVRVRERPAAL